MKVLGLDCERLHVQLMTTFEVLRKLSLHVDLSRYKSSISHHDEMVQSYYLGTYLDIYFEPSKFMFLRRFDDRKEMHCISQKRRDRFTSSSTAGITCILHR